MNSLVIPIERSIASGVAISEDTLAVDLDDGRTISVPIEWFPRLAHASPSERQAWRLIAGGEGIHWEALDEDISIAALLAGVPSQESQKSLRRWLASRASPPETGRPVPNAA